MKQNISHAVMSQRIEPADSLDDFPTPPWAARALCRLLQRRGHPLKRWTAWEPACGRGHMARALAEYFGSVESSDIKDYGYPGTIKLDFTIVRPYMRADAIITNPPFRLAEQFVLTALERADELVGILVRTQFLESVGRHERLFSKHPPLVVAQFVERVPMVRGRCDPEASTATSYCWLIWRKRQVHALPTKFEWIEPCRSALEREGDYCMVAA